MQEKIQEVYFENIESLIVTTINKANNYVFIAVAWLTNKTIINELLKISRRGIKIKILINNDEINDLNIFKELHQHGVELRSTNKLMHNKFCIIDGQILLNGSYNWTNKANHNSENLMRLYSLEIINNFETEFLSLFNKAYKIGEFILSDEEQFNEFIKILEINDNFPFIIDLKKIKKDHIGVKLKKDYLLIKNLSEIKYIFKNFNRNRETFNKKLKVSWTNIFLFSIDSDFKKLFLFNRIKGDYNFINYRLYFDKFDSLIVEDDKYPISYKKSVYLINFEGNIIKEYFYDIIDENGNYCIGDGKGYIKICTENLIEIPNLHAFDFVKPIHEQKVIVCRLKKFYGLVDYNQNVLIDFFNINYQIKNENCTFFETNYLRDHEYTFLFKKHQCYMPEIREININYPNNFSNNIETIYDFQTKTINKIKNHNLEDHYFISYNKGKYKNLYIGLTGKKIERDIFFKVLEQYEKNEDITKIISIFKL